MGNGTMNRAPVQLGGLCLLVGLISIGFKLLLFLIIPWLLLIRIDYNNILPCP